jgi:tRNA dimethylallyltransferase
VQPTVIIIAGPTASGKTALSIALAQQLRAEIISADSRQCYQEMTIGTAKPSQKELAMVPHHFIHSYSIHTPISAAFFETYALEKVETLFKKSNYVVMVGGTGLYLKAFTHGLNKMPEVNDALKQKIEDLYQQNGLVWLQQQVQEKDPFFWNNTIEQNNPHRLLRALIFVESNGVSINSYKQQEPKPRQFKTVAYSLNLPREILYQRINSRVDAMMEAGLLDEVKALTAFQHLPALQTVGYSEIFDYYNGKCTLEIAVEKIKQHTRNYAKRQITWFKHAGNYLPVNACLDQELLMNEMIQSL